MNKTLRGLFVAGVPASLGILFGVGVILYGVQTAHKTEPASAPASQEDKAAQTSGSQTSTTASADDGATKSFVTSTCGACHGQDLKGAFGPSLAAAGQKLSEDEIVTILKNGKGSNMPKGLATGKEADIAKYLKTFK